MPGDETPLSPEGTIKTDGRNAAASPRGFSVLHGSKSGHPLVWMVPSPSQSAVIRELGARVPIIGIRPIQPSSGESPPTLQELGSRYAQVIMRAQPVGSIRIAGYCIGAVLAREAALELSVQGREVSSVVMIDPPDPAETRASFPAATFGARCRRIVRKLAYHAGRVRRLGARDAWRYLRASLRGIGARMNYQRSRRAHEAAIRGEGQIPERYRDSYHVSVAAFQSSIPRVYPGRTAIIRPTDVPAGAFEQPDSRWAQLLGAKVEVEHASGSSDSMWKDDNSVPLAHCILACLHEQ